MAIMVAITLFGLFAAIQLPFLGALVLSVAGLPAFLILLAWGGSWFLAYSALTVTLTGAFGTNSLLALLLPMVFVPAVSLAIALQRKFTPFQAIAAALAFATVFSTATWMLSSSFNAGSQAVMPVEERFVAQVAAFEKVFEELHEKGTDTANLDLFRSNLYEIFDFFVLIIPTTILFLWHLVTIGIFYLGAMKLAGRFSIKLEPLPPFAKWRFDWNLIWLFIVGWMFYYLFGNNQQLAVSDTFMVIGANLLAISRIIYYIAGLSLLFYMFEKYNAGPIIKIGLSCLALVFTQAIIWFGIIDVWADFRAPKPAIISSDDSDNDF